MEKIVITRYQSLVEYLKKIELIDDNTKVLSHAKAEDIRGKHAIGILPYWLSSEAEKFTEVQMRIPSEKRGKELTVEEIEFYALEPKTYTVNRTTYED